MGHSIALSRLKNKVLSTPLPDVKLNSTSGREVGETSFSSLDRAMECPILVQYDFIQFYAIAL